MSSTNLKVREHAYQPGHGGYCTECGQSQRGEGHPRLPATQLQAPGSVRTREGQPLIAMVDVKRVQFHPRNIRQELGDLRELTASIKSDGVLQALRLHRKGTMLQVVDGHRRLASATLAGRAKVPAIIVDELPDDQVIKQALATVLGKRDINRDERRAALRALMDEFGHSAADLAESFGVSVATIHGWAREPKPPAADVPRRAPAIVGTRRVRAVLNEWRDRDRLSEDARALIADIEDLLPAGQVAA